MLLTAFKTHTLVLMKAERGRDVVSTCGQVRIYLGDFATVQVHSFNATAETD
jgi:hypothetical protein